MLDFHTIEILEFFKMLDFHTIEIWNFHTIEILEFSYYRNLEIFIL